MATTPKIVPVGVVKGWERTMEKKVRLQSIFISMSNLAVDGTSTYDKGGKVPDAVISYPNGMNQEGINSITIPAMGELNKQGQGGRETVEGNEETIKLVWKEVHYNVQRKGITVEDKSVDGRQVEYYRELITSRNEALADYFAKLTDYNIHRALAWGGDEYLTETRYWTGPSFPTPPVTKTFHPTVLFPGATAPVTWNATVATYVGNIVTAVNDAGFAATTFTKASLDKIRKYAGKFIKPLGWKSKGNDSVMWVLLLSSEQAEQLTSATGAGSWYETFKDAGARGMDNRVITHIIGIYKNILVMEDPRSMLFDSASGVDTYARVQFVKPWNDAGVSTTPGFEGDNRVPVAKTSSTGTCEVAILMGQTAVGAAKKGGLQYEQQDKDYKFYTTAAAMRAEGCERMDFAPNPASVTARPENWSSLFYFTPTPASSY